MSREDPECAGDKRAKESRGDRRLGRLVETELDWAGLGIWELAGGAGGGGDAKALGCASCKARGGQTCDSREGVAGARSSEDVA